MAELKHRSEMDPRYMWKLEDIFASQDDFEAMFLQAKEEIAAFSAFEGKLKTQAREAIRASFSMRQKVGRLYVYAAMRRDEDGENAFYQGLAARAEALSSEAHTASSFMLPELLELPEETLREIAADPDMVDYDAFIHDVLHQKPHVLPKEQEKLISMASEALSGAAKAFTMLSNVDLPMPMVKTEGGAEEKLTGGRYLMNLHSRDREVRKGALLGMLSAYNAFSSTIAAMYDANVKAARFSARARGFDSCLQESLYADEIPVSVYENLLASVEKALPALNEYLGLRKNILGLDEVHMYDLYVPIVEDFDMKMSYDEAFELVKEGLKPLGEDYITRLSDATREGWADVYENKNKKGGAYSWGCWGVHPYVLLNHTDDLSGCMTLAHELGHAMHSHYSNTAQPFAKAGYSLFVAEVASTCNEVLMMRHLMKKYADDKKAMAFLCNQMLEEFRTTVFRQTMFAAFEKRSHEMCENGEPLTAESLKKEYLALNRRYYGGGCHVDEEISAEWMRIPHFYRDFYVYKYATGFSAAVAIADKILTGGEPAVKAYKRFLSAGGSVPPLDALRLAGVDMEKPDTVESAMQVFADTVRQFRTAMDQ